MQHCSGSSARILVRGMEHVALVPGEAATTKCRSADGRDGAIPPLLPEQAVQMSDHGHPRAVSRREETLVCESQANKKTHREIRKHFQLIRRPKTTSFNIYVKEVVKMDELMIHLKKSEEHERSGHSGAHL